MCHSGHAKVGKWKELDSFRNDSLNTVLGQYSCSALRNKIVDPFPFVLKTSNGFYQWSLSCSGSDAFSGGLLSEQSQLLVISKATLVWAPRCFLHLRVKEWRPAMVGVFVCERWTMTNSLASLQLTTRELLYQCGRCLLPKSSS